MPVRARPRRRPRGPCIRRHRRLRRERSGRDLHVHRASREGQARPAAQDRLALPAHTRAAVVRVSPRLTMAGSCHRGPASQPRAGLAPGAAGPATAGIIAPLLLILAGAVRQARSQGGIRMAHNGARDVSGEAPGLAPGTPVLWPPVLHRGCNDCRMSLLHGWTVPHRAGPAMMLRWRVSTG